MAEKNVILKDGADTLYPKTKAELVEGLPQGGAEWGGITGTLSNQTDLQNALNAKLSLSGGTLMGTLKIPGQLFAVVSTNDRNVLGTSPYNFLFGNSTDSLVIQSPAQDLVHRRSSNDYRILDTYNTAANATLAGTEADLTSLKLDGTTYKIPSGGGSLYAHNLNLVTPASSSFKCMVNAIIVNDSSTPFDSSSLASYLYNGGLTSNNKMMTCCGTIQDNGIGYLAYGIYSSNGSAVTMAGNILDGSQATSGQPNLMYMSDTVTQIL